MPHFINDYVCGDRWLFFLSQGCEGVDNLQTWNDSFFYDF